MNKWQLNPPRWRRLVGQTLKAAAVLVMTALVVSHVLALMKPTEGTAGELALISSWRRLLFGFLLALCFFWLGDVLKRRPPGGPWLVTTNEIDTEGKPAVLCSRGDREFYFCRGSRDGKRVWVCWERKRMFVSRSLAAPSRAEAETAAAVAESELKRLEPEFGICFEPETGNNASAI